MEGQKANSFDSITLKKIGHSFLLTLIAAFGVLLTALSQGIPLDKAIIVSAGTIGSWLVNLAREYNKGE